MPSSPPPDLTLTASERTRFNNAVTAAGLDPDASWNKQIAIAAAGSFAAGDVTTVTVDSVADLNAIVGISPAIFTQPGQDHAMIYPAAIRRDSGEAVSAQTLADSLDYGERTLVRKSLNALVFGDTAKATANVDLINALHFPMTLSVVAAQTLSLADNAVLTLAGGYYLIILGSLSIGSQAFIQSTANLVLNAQVAYSANV